jgi:hypothetical protein
MAEGDGPRAFSEWRDYNEMINGLKLRAANLNLSGETIDEISGLPSRYTAKLLGPNQVRRIGALSLGAFLGALCLKGQFVIDEEAERRLKNRLSPRNPSYVRSAPSIVFTVRFFKKIGRLGAQARIDNSTKAQRQEWARHAAIARWRKANS